MNETLGSSINHIVLNAEQQRQLNHLKKTSEEIPVVFSNIGTISNTIFFDPHYKVVLALASDIYDS